MDDFEQLFEKSFTVSSILTPGVIRVITLILIIIILKLLLDRQFGLREIKREIRDIEKKLTVLSISPAFDHWTGILKTEFSGNRV